MPTTSNVLRMSGLNSGLDTESIVNAMTASTKLKINTNQRKVLKLQGQQDAYRDVISKLTSFKNKYFNILSGSSLTSITNLNKFKSDITATSDKSVKGISVSASASAKEGTYSVEVLAAASQAKVTSASLNTRQSFKPEDYADGKEYAMSVTVGSTTKYITFGGDTKEDVIGSINEQLKSFGKTNDGSGIVSLTDNGNGTFSFNATDKSAITTSVISKLEETKELSAYFASGSNSVSVVIGGETINISFSTIDSNYFDEIFAKEGEAKDEEGFVYGADASKVALFKQVAKDMFETERHEAYEDWKKDDSAYNAEAKSFKDLSDTQKVIFDAEVDAYNDEKLTSAYDKAVLSAYETYEKACKKAGMSVWAEEDSGNKYMSLDEFEDALIVAGGGTAAVRDPDTKKITTPASGGTFGKEAFKENEGVLDFSGVDFTEFVPESKRDDVDLTGINDKINEIYKNSYEKNYEAVARITDDDKDLFFKVGYNEEAAYNKYIYAEDETNPTEEEYVNDIISKTQSGNIKPTEIAQKFNENNVVRNLENITFKDGTKLNVTPTEVDGVITGFTVEAYKESKDESGNTIKTEVGFDILSNSTASEFEINSSKATASTVTNNTKLSDLGLTADSNGKYSFGINGQNFSFDGSTTIKDMISAVNASEAGVTMSFSTLANKFEITSTKYGTDAELVLSDGNEGLLKTLGFRGDETAAGSNLKLKINGAEIETASNSYEVDGVTFTIASNAEVGTTFDVEIKRDTQAMKDLIKSFMEDYNKLVSDIFGYVDEKPNKDYHFLTDDDKAEMDLSDKQEEQWDTVAKKGLLYNDSTVKDVMSRLRMSLLGTISGSDGKAFGLASLGITTSADYGEHGKLVFYNDDESKLDAALSANYEDIVRLFTDSEKGIMQKLSKELDASLKSTGVRSEKGTLIQKAGLATGSSTNDNAIYDQIKSLTTLISSLESRYEKQQDRYWKIYSAMETQMGTLNNQTSYINQLMGM